VLDYGQCIRDLAYTNIFAGDLLLKNFGVTRHGRVIFYDYDELCQVTDCRFREMPEATNPEDEMRGESWFYVADNDVFPETFLNFLAFSDAQREAFLRLHAEVLTADFWRGVQQRLNDGEVLEVVPYHPHRVRVASSY
jgi:isocitrate dehydrogenase kinase/phosphatase